MFLRTLTGRLTYANVASTVSLFILLGGSAYAATSITGNDVKNGSLTSADVKDRSLRARDFKPGALPAGPQGERGPQGPAGIPDTSNFFTKAESDGRVVRGSGRITPIPVLDLPNGGEGTLADVPGVGTLEARGCAYLNVHLQYTNRSGAPQSWVLEGSYHSRLNVPADSGSVGPGEALDNVHNDAAGFVRLSIAGEHPATFEVARAQAANGRCLLWGHVLTHG